MNRQKQEYGSEYRLNSIALVWTKYQYHILTALLRTLKIDRKTVAVVIFTKAARQGVTGEGFGKVIIYDAEEERPIRDWSLLKKDIQALLKTLPFIPENIFLRNYDSIIGRMLLSDFTEANVYFFEEGTASYRTRNVLGYPFGMKDVLRNILLRMFFGKALLKVLPLPVKNVCKVGLFPDMDLWLKAQYIPIKLTVEDFFATSDTMDHQATDVEVLILEQPLWQAGFDDESLVLGYQFLYEYASRNITIDHGRIMLKMHPASDMKRVSNILEQGRLKDKIKILETDKNLEEMLLGGELVGLKMIIGFCSSGLFLAKGLLKHEDIEVVAFSTPMMEKRFKDIYSMFRKIGIKHVKGEG